MRIALRADASPRIGHGHVSRCLALAQALIAQGDEVYLVARELPHAQRVLAQEAGCHVVDLPGRHEPLDAVRDAHDTAAALQKIGGVAVCLVDHYALDAAWHAEVRGVAQRIAVIDDLADRRLDCDLLLDQNLTRDGASRFDGKVPAACRMLIGPQHALLRPAFVSARATLSRGAPKMQHILISYGGADPTGETEKALAALAVVPGIAGVDVTVVFSAAHPKLAAVQAAARRLPHARVMTDVTDMAALYAQCDLALGAGGVSAWERACLAVPTVLTCIADNQRAACEALAEAGYVVYLGEASQVDTSRIAQVVSGLMVAPAWRAWLARHSAGLCDGRGAARVAAALRELAEEGAPAGGLRVSVVCSDPVHPVWARLEAWSVAQRGRHAVRLVQKAADAGEGDILFLISCAERVRPETRARFGATLVVHASDLPRGRGWSPLVWQIVEGRNDICVSLIEADDPIDSGRIWAQHWLHFQGHELVDEIHEALFTAELVLMDRALDVFGSVAPQAQPAGEVTHYRKRTPEDSRIDPNRSIAEQFDLLRVADPQRYPAFFDLRGHRYVIHLSRQGEAPS